MDADPEILGELPDKHLRKQLAAIVRKIQWSYAMFWSTSTRQPSVLAWSDGYYNGDIETRKTTQAKELEAEQMGLQRSEQLRELYESLSAGDTNQQTRRPSASLSPEDLTDTEWYYLVCMTFTFSLGQGLPGKAFTNNQHIWLNNAQFADSKIFSRSLLAKSASIQTVVCIPFRSGVLELGKTESILEDPALIKHITSFFWELPNPVSSKQSISSPEMAETGEDILCPNLDNDIDNSMALEDQNLITDGKKPLESDPSHFPFTVPSYVPTEQRESANDKVEELHTNIYEELSIDSPDDSSNVCCLTQQLEDLFGIDGLNGISQTQDSQFIDDEFSNALHGSLNSDKYASKSFVNAQRIVSSAKRERTSNQILDSLQERTHSKFISLDLDGDDSHYAKTVATILRNSKPVLCFLKVSQESSFIVWVSSFSTPKPFTSTPKKLLKKIFVDRAWLRGDHLPKCEENELQEKVQKPGGDSGASYVLSERKHKLNEKFLILKSLVPSIGKVDKTSILSETTEYLKHLERRVKELESCLGSAELGTRDRMNHPDVAERTSDNYVRKAIISGRKPSANKRKAFDIEEAEADHHCVISMDGPIDISVTAKENEVLVEMHCPWREYLLLEIVESMSNFHLHPLSVQSSTADGMLAMTVKSKIRSTTIASPAMIKRSLQKVIGKCL